MGAVRAKLESFKPPHVAPIGRGRVTMPKLTPGRQSTGKALNPMAMISMMRSLEREKENRQNSIVLADTMTTKRSGAMQNNQDMIEQVDSSLAEIDELLKSLQTQ